jgi:hypothetical protein
MMKITITKNRTATISGLTETEFYVLTGIADVVDKRCFRERDDDGEWYSNDDFVLHLTDDQRRALAKIGGEIRKFWE